MISKREKINCSRGKKRNGVRLWFIERGRGGEGRDGREERATPNEFKCPPLRASNYGARGVHDRISFAIEFNRKYGGA